MGIFNKEPRIVLEASNSINIRFVIVQVVAVFI